MMSLLLFTLFKMYSDINNIENFESDSQINAQNFNNSFVEPENYDNSYLIFSVGSKNLNNLDVERLGIGRGRGSMADGLTDSIMLILTNKDMSKIGIISINRDMYIEEAGRRINEAYNMGGIDLLKKEVFDLTGIMPEHELMVNFAGFSDVIDEIGGVNIYLKNPVYDKYAKLEIKKTGCVTMDGKTALSFARSRHFFNVDASGNYYQDSTSNDYGRIERQQSIIRSLSKKIIYNKLYYKIPRLLDLTGKNLTVDSELTGKEIIKISYKIINSNPKIYASTLPSKGTIINGASVTLPIKEGILYTINEIKSKINNENISKIKEDNSFDVNNDPDFNTPIRNTWRPDNGIGDGGKLYPSC